MRPTRKEKNRPTFHKDGTTSFFNEISGEWERASHEQHRAAKKAAWAAAKAGRKLYKDDGEKLREKHLADAAALRA